MKKKNRFIHIYLAIWSLYMMQGTLYSSEGTFSVFLLAFLLLVSIFFFIYASIAYKLPRVLKTLSIIMIIFTIYGVLGLLFGKVYYIAESGKTGITAIGYLKNIYVSLLPIYTSYIASKHGDLGEKELRFWTFVLLMVAIVGFYRQQREALIYMLENGINREETTNNGSYAVLAIVCLLPLFYKKPLLQYVLLAVCMSFVIIGMKRGAMLCGVFASLWFLYKSIKAAKQKHRKLLVILTIGIIGISLYAVNYMLNNSDYFVNRLESTMDGSSSNRDMIYTSLINYMLHESDIFHLLFGNGANATLGIAMNFAHNDWLEIAIDNGLIMVVLYLIYWARMLKTIKLSKNNHMCYMMISIFFIINFIRTFFSMSYGDVPISASVALGFALANYNRNDDVVYSKNSKTR